LSGLKNHVKEWCATNNDFMPTGGRSAALDEHLNALWHLLRNGCAWWALPDEVFEDSTHCKVHQHANGSKDRAAQAVGRSGGGLNTKIHAVCDALLRLAGKLILTGGNVSDFTTASDLTADLHDCVVTGDKGFDSREHRRHLRSCGYGPCIPSRRNTTGALQ